MTPARAVLGSMLMEAGGLPESQPSTPLVSFDDEIDKSYHGSTSGDYSQVFSYSLLSLCLVH